MSQQCAMENGSWSLGSPKEAPGPVEVTSGLRPEGEKELVSKRGHVFRELKLSCWLNNGEVESRREEAGRLCCRAQTQAKCSWWENGQVT